ncbi:MAG TPA: asparagine synthase-related protein, partial [Roseiflexaceae bacterium]|nr:asparagine synthase-related protein [Roseiflexaceae bacterium]
RGSAAARKAAALLESDGTLAAAYPVLRQVLPAERRRALLAERVRRAAAGEPDPYVGLLAVAGAGDGRDLGAQVAFAELRTYTHDLLLRDTDQMSMAHGLEVRVPLLDHVVVEYAMGVPGTAWSPGRAPKALLAEALSGLLPAEVLRRPKQGFALPFDPWMRGPLRRFCEERLARLGERGLLQAGALQELWEDFLARRGGATWSRVWLLVVLDEWLERNGF